MNKGFTSGCIGLFGAVFSLVKGKGKGFLEVATLNGRSRMSSQLLMRPFVRELR